VRHYLSATVYFFVFSIPSFSQELEKNWKEGLPAFKAKNEVLNPSAKIDNEKVYVRNRGLLVSNSQYPKGVTLEFVSKWTLGKDDGSYQDVLTVAFRTSGKQREKWSHEILDGIAVRIAGHAQTLSIEHFKKGVQSSDLIARVPFKTERGKEQKIKILEEKGLIQVFLEGKEVLYARVPIIDDASNIAFYNREPVAGVQQEWILSGLKISGK
jgi:hypothetical protein